jgi:hypothetical protein
LTDDLDDFPMFLGRAGCMYVKKGLSTPFHLGEFAEAWRQDGITFSHCVVEMERHLAKNSGQYRNGSGDWGLRWLDAEIRESWARLRRPPHALPERTDRLYKRNAAFDDSDERFVDPMDSAQSTARPIDLKPIEKGGLGGEPRDVPGDPNEMRSSPRAASDRADTAPTPVDPIGLKPIDKAEAFLRRELANGEVAAAVIEQYARDDGISPRTLDRARSRLRVVTRRSGFGRTGKSWLSLPTTP